MPSATGTNGISPPSDKPVSTSWVIIGTVRYDFMTLMRYRCQIHGYDLVRPVQHMTEHHPRTFRPFLQVIGYRIFVRPAPTGPILHQFEEKGYFHRSSKLGSSGSMQVSAQVSRNLDDLFMENCPISRPEHASLPITTTARWLATIASTEQEFDEIATLSGHSGVSETSMPANGLEPATADEQVLWHVFMPGRRPDGAELSPLEEDMGAAQTNRSGQAYEVSDSQHKER